MSKRLAFTVILILLAAGQTRAAYRGLLKEYESYSPPVYYHSGTTTKPARADMLEDPAYTAEKKQLETMRSRWEKTLEASQDNASFYRPDSERLNQVRTALSDPDGLNSQLKGSFSLETLQILVLLRNSGVQAAQDRVRAVLEQFDQVSSLDDILRRYSAFSESLMPGVGPMKGKEPIQMKFPFPGVLALKGEVVAQEVQAAAESLEAVRRDTVTDARIAFWNLCFVNKARAVTGKTLRLLNQLEAVANNRYEAGKTSFQDVIKVRINRETLQTELVTLREKQGNLEAKIRELVNLAPDIEVGTAQGSFAVQKTPSLDELYALARDRRQELRKMRAMVGKMQRMIEMAETMILPSYSFNLSLYQDEAVMQVGSVAMQETFPVLNPASTGAGLPKMPWFGSNDAFLRETRAKLAALQKDLAEAEARTNSMVRRKWFELDRSRREEDLFRYTVVRLSQAALDVSSSGYESGKVSFADVIASYTMWLQANLSLERKRSDYEIAWAELEQVVGTGLRDKD